MDRKKVLYIALMVVLVALLLFGQWYKRPLDMETITGVTDPDDISISVIRQDKDMDLEQRNLNLSAGDEGFDELLAQLEELQFRRPPTNLITSALSFLPSWGTTSKEVEDGGFQHLMITLSQPGADGEQVYGYVGFWVDEWEYRDFDHDISLPLVMEDGKDIGQDLCAQLWDVATPVEPAEMDS